MDRCCSRVSSENSFSRFHSSFDSCMAQHDEGNVSSVSSRTNDRRKVSNIPHYELLLRFRLFILLYFIFFDILNGCSASVSNISVTR